MSAFTPIRIELLRGYAARQLDVTPPEPAKLKVRETTLSDREQAYALALQIMSEADRLWLPANA